jgi:hypothetical protein
MLPHGMLSCVDPVVLRATAVASVMLCVYTTFILACCYADPAAAAAAVLQVKGSTISTEVCYPPAGTTSPG